MKHLLLLLMVPFTFSGEAELIHYSPSLDLTTLPDEQPKIEVIEEKGPHRLFTRSFNTS